MMNYKQGRSEFCMDCIEYQTAVILELGQVRLASDVSYYTASYHIRYQVSCVNKSHLVPTNPDFTFTAFSINTYIIAKSYLQSVTNFGNSCVMELLTLVMDVNKNY